MGVEIRGRRGGWDMSPGQKLALFLGFDNNEAYEGGMTMTYVDGFVVPVSKKNIKAYTRMAQWGRKMWMKHGALQYFERVGDDFKPMPGCSTFPKMAKLKAGETAFFSFVIYKSKAHRTAVNKSVMKAMGKVKMPEKMPFDPKRTAMGGFRTVVEG